jgi:aminoglycoside phosphotransferase (APT) family kinase protein
MGDGERAIGAPLAGGVSSDLWRVVIHDGRSVCVKRARPRLRVEERWEVSVDRNRFEVEWLRLAADIVPGFAPRIIHIDPTTSAFVMEDLSPSPVWKDELRAGRVDVVIASELAARLVTLQAFTAADTGCAARFPTDALFSALRIEPYLGRVAERHPELAPRLRALAERLASTHVALVHGDVSPKNVLVAPNGPVLLDAECAWYGDPAFDLAFCVNHLLLKCRWCPGATVALLGAADTFIGTYLEGVSWEPADDLARRAGELLPALLLARVDGRSPVEYLDESDKVFVRDAAATMLAAPAQDVREIRIAWANRLDPYFTRSR